jgi:hypothetical protein
VGSHLPPMPLQISLTLRSNVAVSPAHSTAQVVQLQPLRAPLV